MEGVLFGCDQMSLEAQKRACAQKSSKREPVISYTAVKTFRCKTEGELPYLQSRNNKNNRSKKNKLKIAEDKQCRRSKHERRFCFLCGGFESELALALSERVGAANKKC
eukprot:1178402-Prorocentrum_minimum.AAC.3